MGGFEQRGFLPDLQRRFRIECFSPHTSLCARRGSRLIFQAPSILYHSTIISKEPRLELIIFMSAQGAGDYRIFELFQGHSLTLPIDLACFLT